MQSNCRYYYQVYEAVNKYRNSHIPHILIREYDYIQNPKESGYRSYHMIYKFQNDEYEFYNKNMFIEIQFRTKLQHIWATAVEMMGIYTKSNLKSSQGDKGILRFFTLVSSVFAKIEETPICPNTDNYLNYLLAEIKDIDKEINIISKINALSVAIKYTNDNFKQKGYYLLQLNYNEKTLRINNFSSTQVEAATNSYNRIEALNNTDLDVVLVSATSFDSLKAAYPNYFVDISQFVNMLNGLLGYSI